jgi:hypothetical protein
MFQDLRVLDRVILNLLIGPAVPVPAPKAVMDALTAVQVTSAARQPSGFQLTFQLAARSPLLSLLLLTGGSVPPVLRVVIYVTLGGQTQVLIDGVITDQQVSTGTPGAPATLTVTGRDITTVMGLINFDGIPYPAMPIEARLALIIAKYAALGVIPLIIPSVLADVPNPLASIPRQQGTDLEYIQLLAELAGYVFYSEPGPVPGTSIAYWGPEIRAGEIQPALNADMDAHANIESLSFRFNNEKATQYIVWIQEPISKLPIPIPIPNVSLLSPPLGLIPPLPNRIAPLETGKLNPIQAALYGLARQSQSMETVTANGTLDVVRYGSVLKPRRLVGVRGAGNPFDGLYYVDSVTHQIRRGEYKQNFTLSRNGLVSTVPKVPV